jgi:hypothetical protein
VNVVRTYPPESILRGSQLLRTGVVEEFAKADDHRHVHREDAQKRMAAGESGQVCVMSLVSAGGGDIFFSTRAKNCHGMESLMSRFLKFTITVSLVGLATITSACTPAHNSNRADFQYQPRNSVNPACADGFRPNNARSCSY